MTKLIERCLFKMCGWWRWKRRLKDMKQYSLNAFSGEKMRIMVSEPDHRSQHMIHIERIGYDKQWRRVGSITQTEFPELMALLVDAGNFIHPGSLRWKVVGR